MSVGGKGTGEFVNQRYTGSADKCVKQTTSS